MVKTRSQNKPASVNVEEHATSSSSTRLLHGTNNTTTSKHKNKITKVSKNNASTHKPPSEKVAISNGQSTQGTLSNKRRHVTTEQIRTLIDLIVNKKMEVAPAARQVNMSSTCGMDYYTMYLNDPEHKIPLPRGALLSGPTCAYKTKDIQRLMHYLVEDKLPIQVAASKMNMGLKTAKSYYERFKEIPSEDIQLHNPSIQVYTQEQINKLIACFVNEKKSILAASRAVNMSYATASKFIKMYKNDPEHKIPKPMLYGRENRKQYTREEIKTLIDYIVVDKMSVYEASKKSGMNSVTGSKYYHRYLEDTSTIPEPRKANNLKKTPCSQEQIKQLIQYIVDDEMSVSQASKKANMTGSTGQKYYSRYIRDPERKIPIPGANDTHRNGRCLTDDQVREFFGAIINDKITIARAALKANIASDTATNYYSRVMKGIREAEQQGKTDRISCPKERAQKLFEYILVDGMSIASASRKAQMSERTARRYYKQYKNNPEGEIIIPETVFCTPEQIKSLIDIVNTEKVTVVDAAKRVGMNRRTAHVYFRKYMNDPEHKIPVPAKSKYNTRRDIFEGHLKIVTDLYNKAKEKDKELESSEVVMIKQETLPPPSPPPVSSVKSSTLKRKPLVKRARKSIRKSNNDDSGSSSDSSSGDEDEFNDSDSSYDPRNH